MSLNRGDRLGPYDILAPLGAGGMGEVYRGKDTKLGRDVALKLLPASFTRDPERVARFRREAQVLASLNHPHIAQIYGLDEANGTQFLVLEFVDGGSLDRRVAGGPIPIDEALPIARQIAEALEAAHEKGIVHRDLKPANIAVAKDGNVKVLDFGLAKAVDTTTGSFDLTNSPTITSPAMMTGIGVILGTAAYMAPEQAKGRAADKRSDVWAFGCIVYEMLTGKPAFAGETLTDVLATIVRDEPDLGALPDGTPDAVRSLVRRCLKKNPTDRLHDFADARIEIDEALAEPASGSQSASVSFRRSPVRIVPWALTALFALALLITQVKPWTSASPHVPVTRLEFNMPGGVEVGSTNSPNLAISPDGSRLAFLGSLGGLRQVYVRKLDEFDAGALGKGTETANDCAFSPDGGAVAFITSDRALRRFSFADGLTTTLSTDADFTGGGLTWGSDNRITFGRAGALWQTSADGGPARRLTTLNADRDERAHPSPFALPGDRAILFTVVTGGDRIATHIESFSFATGQRRTVTADGRYPLYAASGHLLFFKDGSLLAAPFNPDTLEVTGAAVAVLNNVSLDQMGNPMVTVSNAGQLAYVPSSNATKQLVWVSRQGVEEPITDTPRPYQNPRLAPDGQRIVVEVAGGDLWTQNTARGTFTRLTTRDAVGNTFAVWTPDARRVVFRSLTGIRWIEAEGASGSHGIPGTTIGDIPTSISPDGRTLVFIKQSSPTSGDLYSLSLEGDPNMRPIVQTSGYDGGGQFSPDGHWLAYVSNESGQFEVYVRPYPGPDRKIPVSTHGGTHPKWNPSGKELFYRDGNRMMAVDISTGPELRISQPHLLFELRYAFGSAQSIANYDVSPDGQRFLMVKDESSSGRLNIVLNWFDELGRHLPSR